MTASRRRFAERTAVGADKTKSDIERILTRYGAGQFLYASDGERGLAMIGFTLSSRMVRIRLPLPLRSTFSATPTGRSRSSKAADLAYEQALRQHWRALLLVITAKLEAISAGISTFDDEFLAFTLLPDGRTVGEWALPQLESVYTSGRMPPLLPG